MTTQESKRLMLALAIVSGRVKAATLAELELLGDQFVIATGDTLREHAERIIFDAIHAASGGGDQ